MTEHDTNIYIDVLKDLDENMNSSFNSGVMCAPNDAIQIDLMDVSNISTKNKNYKYIFVCVDGV